MYTEFQRQPMPGTEPHSDGVPRAAVRAEQYRRFGRPPVHGAAALIRHECRRILILERIVADRTPPGAGPLPKLACPSRIPKVAVQVKAKPSVGIGMRVTVRSIPVPRPVPERETDPLARIRPSWRRPSDEVYRAADIGARIMVPGQGNGQTRAQQAVRSDPRKVPAQQIRSQMTEVRAHQGRDISTLCAGYGTQVHIDIDMCCRARACPVTRSAASGRGFDH